MSKPRGQKAPRRFRLVTVFELPATSQRLVPVWWLLEVYFGGRWFRSHLPFCVLRVLSCVPALSSRHLHAPVHPAQTRRARRLYRSEGFSRSRRMRA